MATDERKPLVRNFNNSSTFGGVHYTLDHSGKMSGIKSLSTLASANPICIRRHEKAKDNCICKYCFSYTYTKMRKGLRDRLKSNLDILSKRVLNDNEIPVIYDPVFRLESFGDIMNKTQVCNYFKLAELNPATTFALWTKNPRIIFDAMNEDGLKKPANMIIILSSPLLNTPVRPNEKHTFIDKVFTVYDKQYAQENPDKINCGARSCITCQRCYKHNTGNKVEQIREKLK